MDVCTTPITSASNDNTEETMRQVKTENEIRAITKAAGLTDLIFSRILPSIKPGIHENQLAARIINMIRRSGARPSFKPIVAFGTNTCQVHYRQTTNAKLKSDDIVLVDFGAQIDGYCSDMTRVVFVGIPRNEWLHAYETVSNAQQCTFTSINRLIGVNMPVSGAQLDKEAKSMIADSGYEPYPHSLGHGIGLHVHEDPRLTVHKDAILLPGMVFSVEPGVYIPGEYGIRIEDLVHLQKDKLEILSKTSKDVIRL